MSARAQGGRPQLFWFGVAGLIGALLTGLGEGLMQLVPNGDFADPSYGYFRQVAPGRLAVGHWLAICAAPLYLAGYWYLTGRLMPRAPALRLAVFCAMSWAFMLAMVWIGQRALLAHAVQAASSGAASMELVGIQAGLHEPLVNALRLAILGFSGLWIAFILAGRSQFPRWMALFSPGLVLGLIFLIYLARPSLGWLFLPTAMNTAHAIVFALCLAAPTRAVAQ
jgi:hypothetical protein